MKTLITSICTITVIGFTVYGMIFVALNTPKAAHEYAKFLVERTK